jgi:hypothetical protein
MFWKSERLALGGWIQRTRSTFFEKCDPSIMMAAGTFSLDLSIFNLDTKAKQARD